MSRETVCGVFAAWSTLLAVYIPNFSPPVASGEPYHSEDQTCCETKARTCRDGGSFRETETRNAICLAFLNACDSAVAPLDDLAQLAELDLNAQRRDR